MKICNSSFEILEFDTDALQKIERAARLCYQSEPAGDPEDFVRRLIKRGHHTPLEHISITVRIVCDRGVLAELTRHRLASFNVESTRYANYSKDKFGNEITVIKPSFWKEDSSQYDLWLDAMAACEDNYMLLLASGATPEQARTVLPMSLKTEIIMTCNLREMRHILDLRCSAKAHIQIREIMIPLLKEVYARCPVVFEDVYLKYCSK